MEGKIINLEAAVNTLVGELEELKTEIDTQRNKVIALESEITQIRENI